MLRKDTKIIITASEMPPTIINSMLCRFACALNFACICYATFTYKNQNKIQT
ncbi:hypothetical protein [Pseudoalteromonas citrea]|uniref:hypothetical protein n=1 Tax=Pseudoalteromonas citrea TaxID=43655 RepID=UPI003B58B14D